MSRSVDPGDRDGQPAPVDRDLGRAWRGSFGCVAAELDRAGQDLTGQVSLVSGSGLEQIVVPGEREGDERVVVVVGPWVGELPLEGTDGAWIWTAG